MRIGFRASHLLHYRPLIATACELEARGHEVFVQCASNSLLMRVLHRNYTPTKMRWVDQESLRWLSHYICYRPQWELACQNVTFCRQLPTDCITVSTIKDIETLKKGDFALGYQHLPVTIKVGYPIDTINVDSFFYASDFARHHKFPEIMSHGTAYGTKFAHLSYTQSVKDVYSKYVMILHPGSDRGTPNNDWLQDTIDIIYKAGLKPIIKTHPVPGKGSTSRDLREQYHGVMVSDAWWYPTSNSCCCVLSVGSSALYEMWSTGYTSVYILNYVEGRKNNFMELNSCLISSKDVLYSLLVEGRFAHTDWIDETAFSYYDVPSNTVDIIEGFHEPDETSRR